MASDPLGEETRRPGLSRRWIACLAVGLVAVAALAWIVAALGRAGPVRRRVVGLLLDNAIATEHSFSWSAKRIEALGGEGLVWDIHQSSECVETLTGKSCEPARQAARRWLGSYALRHGNPALKEFARSRLRSLVVDESECYHASMGSLVWLVLAAEGSHDAYVDVLVGQGWGWARDALGRLARQPTSLPKSAVFSLGLARLSVDESKAWEDTSVFREALVLAFARVPAVRHSESPEGAFFGQALWERRSEAEASNDPGECLAAEIWEEYAQAARAAVGEDEPDFADLAGALALLHFHPAELRKEGPYSGLPVLRRKRRLVRGLAASEDRDSFVGRWRGILWRLFPDSQEGVSGLQELAQQAKAEGRDYAYSLCKAAADLLNQSPLPQSDKRDGEPHD